MPSPPYEPAYADVLATGDQYRTCVERSVHAERAQHEQQQRIRAERLTEQFPEESEGEELVSALHTPENSESSDDQDESQGQYRLASCCR